MACLIGFAEAVARARSSAQHQATQSGKPAAMRVAAVVEESQPGFNNSRTKGCLREEHTQVFKMSSSLNSGPMQWFGPRAALGSNGGAQARE